MISGNYELIWQGRLHLGDEPGIYGDAQYAGLCTELPFTIMKAQEEGHDIIQIAVTASDVRTYPGYPGHEVSIVAYGHAGGKWKEAALGTAKLWDSDTAEINIDLSGIEMPLFAAVRIKVDTTVPAGLYDDFVLKNISMRSPDSKYYASFGFRPLSKWRIVVLESEK